MVEPGEGYRATFDARGHRYDDAMVRWPHVRDEEFAFVVGLLAPVSGEVVVDVPAGGSYLADHLPSGVDVVAVETSVAFAERARARHVDAVVGDLFAVGLPDGHADAVVSVAGVHHEDDHGALFAGWRRLLRPGGRLVAADVAQGSAVAEFLDGYVGRWCPTGHHGSYLGPDLAEVVAAAGYREVAVHDGAYHWWADSERELGAFCASLFGLEGVGPDEVATALADGPGLDRADDGRVGVRWGLRAVTATAPR